MLMVMKIILSSTIRHSKSLSWLVGKSISPKSWVEILKYSRYKLKIMSINIRGRINSVKCQLRMGQIQARASPHERQEAGQRQSLFSAFPSFRSCCQGVSPWNYDLTLYMTYQKLKVLVNSTLPTSWIFFKHLYFLIDLLKKEEGRGIR